MKGTIDMKYNFIIEVESKNPINQDILECIEEDIPEGVMNVIKNITDREILSISCKIKERWGD